MSIVPGAGAALALASDVRVAVQGTRLNASFVKLGLTGVHALFNT